MEGPFPKDIVKDAKESCGEHERKDVADVSSQEDQDEILVNKQRLGTEFASKKRATPPPSISPVPTSSPPLFTPYTADNRQETPVTHEAEGSEPKPCILEDNILADLGEHSEDLALVIRSTTDLEYHKALIAERLIMKVLEMKMREKEMDHLLEMAKIQANKEVLLARYQSEMISRCNATSSYNHDTSTCPSEE
ncbi:hypothetical protein BGW42_005918 [Actinomortierella wolfii]|nr:hypothetical protein BGW42_005918 [Actinomortierella wolfii]